MLIVNTSSAQSRNGNDPNPEGSNATTPPSAQPSGGAGPQPGGRAALAAPRPRGTNACGARGAVPANSRHQQLTAQRCALRFLPIHGRRIPVHAARDANSRIVGWINRAGTRTWFVGQAQGKTYRAARDFNSNWAYSQAGNKAWGWVPGLYFAVGANGKPDTSLEPCGSRCRPY